MMSTFVDTLYILKIIDHFHFPLKTMMSSAVHLKITFCFCAGWSYGPKKATLSSVSISYDSDFFQKKHYYIFCFDQQQKRNLIIQSNNSKLLLHFQNNLQVHLCCSSDSLARPRLKPGVYFSKLKKPRIREA